MAFALAPSAHEPLSEINTTPLIDVLLVLLIMIIMSIPMKPHSLDVPLPQKGPRHPLVSEPDPVRNKIILTSEGEILWNGDAVSRGELSALLVRTTELRSEPELQFEPEANASYDLAAKVIDTIVDSGVTRLGFVGNERYREFSR